MGLSGTPIVVLGMHRSGTSVVSKALARLGVYWGQEADLVPPDEHNPSGYWELKELFQLNLRCLDSLDMSYDRVGPFPEGWKEFPRSGPLLKQLESTLIQHFVGHSLWGLKQPLATVLVPFYAEAFRRLGVRPHYVLCFRNPLDVAGSLSKRDRLAEGPALGAWLRYTLLALKNTAGESRSAVLYSQFVNDPKASLGVVAGLISGWQPGDDAWRDACGSVRSELSHNWRPVEDLNSHPPLLKRAFELCLAIAADVEAFNSGKFDSGIEGLWDEFADWNQLLIPPGPPKGVLGLHWTQSGKSAHRILPPSASWQKVGISFAGPPESSISGTVYNMPSSIWIRAAKWRVRGKELPCAIMAGPNAHLGAELGIQRLSASVGPDQLVILTPNEPGPYELELEVFVESNLAMTLELVRRLELQLAFARQQVAQKEPPGHGIQARRRP